MGLSKYGIGAGITRGLLGVLLIGCATTDPALLAETPPSGEIAVQTHPLPDLSTAYTGAQDWSETPCSYPQTETRYLGGLSPKVPILICKYSYSSESDPPDIGYVKDNGSNIWQTSRLYYIVKKDGKWLTLDSQQKFIDFYTPIETPEEALSFVLALSNYRPLTQAEVQKPYGEATTEIEIKATETEETTLHAIDSHFEIHHLLRGGKCTLKSSRTTAVAVNLKVTPNGEFEELSQTELYIVDNCPVA